MAWKPGSKFIIFCASIFWMWIAELALIQQNAAGQSIFHAYAKPRRAPDFTLEDLQGKMVALQDHRGRVILLNFWATW